MEQFAIEMHVAPGMARDFKVSSVFYGLLVHTRTADNSAGTREQLEFWPFRGDSEPLEYTGVQLDRQRQEFERGHETELDEKLVRGSTFMVRLDDFRPLGLANLQQVFVLLKARRPEGFAASLQARLCLSRNSQSNVRVLECRDDLPAPQRLWHKKEWADVNALEGIRFGADVREYVEEAKARLNELWKRRTVVDPRLRVPPSAGADAGKPAGAGSGEGRNAAKAPGTGSDDRNAAKTPGTSSDDRKAAKTPGTGSDDRNAAKTPGAGSNDRNAAKTPGTGSDDRNAAKTPGTGSDDRNAPNTSPSREPPRPPVSPPERVSRREMPDLQGTARNLQKADAIRRASRYVWEFPLRLGVFAAITLGGLFLYALYQNVAAESGWSFDWDRGTAVALACAAWVILGVRVAANTARIELSRSLPNVANLRHASRVDLREKAAAMAGEAETPFFSPYGRSLRALNETMRLAGGGQSHVPLRRIRFPATYAIVGLLCAAPLWVFFGAALYRTSLGALSASAETTTPPPAEAAGTPPPAAEEPARRRLPERSSRSRVGADGAAAGEPQAAAPPVARSDSPIQDQSADDHRARDTRDQGVAGNGTEVATPSESAPQDSDAESSGTSGALPQPASAPQGQGAGDSVPPAQTVQSPTAAQSADAPAPAQSGQTPQAPGSAESSTPVQAQAPQPAQTSPQSQDTAPVTSAFQSITRPTDQQIDDGIAYLASTLNVTRMQLYASVPVAGSALAPLAPTTIYLPSGQRVEVDWCKKGDRCEIATRVSGRGMDGKGNIWGLVGAGTLLSLGHVRSGAITGHPLIVPVEGTVEGYDIDGWPIVRGKVIRLSGIAAIASAERDQLRSWIARHGGMLSCKLGSSMTYTCLTPQGVDVAQAILVNGAGTASADAPETYRASMREAQQSRRGQWSN